MTAATLLVFAAIAVLVVAVTVYVGRPLLGGGAALAPADRRAVALLTEREALLATVRDLDADRASGRLDEPDYQRLRAESVQRGAVLLAALDTLAAEADGATARLSAELEAEVAARVDPAAAVAIAGRQCLECGHACGPADRFCGGCGRALEANGSPAA